MTPLLLSFLIAVGIVGGVFLFALAIDRWWWLFPALAFVLVFASIWGLAYHTITQ